MALALLSFDLDMFVSCAFFQLMNDQRELWSACERLPVPAQPLAFIESQPPLFFASTRGARSALAGASTTSPRFSAPLRAEIRFGNSNFLFSQLLLAFFQMAESKFQHAPRGSP